MFTCAEFQIIGRIGSVREVGPTLKISIAANERWTDRQTGEAKEKTRWNTVTVFDRNPGFAWLKENLVEGDVVRAIGTMEDDEYEKDGVKVYTTLLKADRVSVIPTGKKRGE